MSDVQRFPSEKLRSVCSSSTCRCRIYIPPNSLACKCSSIDVDSCRLCKYFASESGICAKINKIFEEKCVLGIPVLVCEDCEETLRDHQRFPMLRF